MIWGKANEITQYSNKSYGLNYWLSSVFAYGKNYMWYVNAERENIDIMYGISNGNIGVRPVIEVSKSSITKAGEGNPTTENPTTYTTYRKGAPVALKSNPNERFYVLEDSDANTETVTLLAKTCLNNTDYSSQVADTATRDDYGCAFSTKSYWENETLPTNTPYFNLNNYNPVKNETVSAVYRANAYAVTNCGATEGRLLTYEEAKVLYNEGMISSYMLCGQFDLDTGSYTAMDYWLGSADGKSGVHTMDGIKRIHVWL